MAAFNALAGPLKGAMEGKLGIQQAGWSPGMPIDLGDGNAATVDFPGGGGIPSIGLPGVGDFLKPIPDAGLQPKHIKAPAHRPAQHRTPPTTSTAATTPSQHSRRPATSRTSPTGDPGLQQ